MAVHLLPASVFLGGIPDYLGIGADQQVVSPAFQLLPLGAVYYLVIVPAVGNPHNIIYPF